jgi:TRAP-type uncharacterized transport system substrate-binding protein
MKYPHLVAMALFALLNPNRVHGQDSSADSTPAPANPNAVTILIADGSTSHTYETIISQLKPFVQDSVTLQEVPSTGAVQNLDLLINNKVQLAMLHNDVYEFRSKSNPAILDKYKTVLKLYSEEVHFVALKTSKRMVGASFFSKGTPMVLNTIEDLKDLNVGAAGGGAISAQVIKLETDIPYHFIEYKKGDDVLAALNNGDIDAAVFVGGAPLTNLENLGPDYQILSIPSTDVDKLKQVYHAASVTYTNMRPDSVDTVAADCVLIGRVYKTPKFINALATLRAAVDTKLTEIQETTGSHPKWQEVQPSSDNHGTLPWMDLPAPAGATAAPAPTAPGK